MQYVKTSLKSNTRGFTIYKDYCAGSHKFTIINTFHNQRSAQQVLYYSYRITNSNKFQFQLTHDSGKKQKNLDKYPMLCIQFWAPDDGRRNRPKYVEHL
jgi:hypothetical protein